MTTAPLPMAETTHGGWLGEVEESINAAFDPVASAVTSVVFWEVPLGEYSFPLIVLWLVAAAAVFTVYFRGIQFRGVGTSIALVRGKYSRASDPGEVTHFQALTSAVSGTVGLGNIAGVGAAVTIGGPGATFWMILAGLLGMCTKFVECTLGVKYREVHEDGTITGGPFRYLPVAFERFGAGVSRALTLVFAVALFFFGAVGGNMFQANQTFAQAQEVTGGEDGFLGSAGSALVFGIVLALLVGAVILGGITSIGVVTSRLVPMMALIYVGACLLVIGSNADRIGAAVGEIVSGAFAPEGVAGGAIGVLIVGFQRAAFSNEAGVGSAPIAHSAVKTRHPVSEGFVALLEPFIDTVVICTMTALTIVIADTAYYSEQREVVAGGGAVPDGVLVTSDAFETFLPSFPVILAIAVALFAFSTLITWSYYSMKAWTTLFGRTPTSELIFKALFCVFTVIGTVISFGSVVDFADAMLFVCAVVNLLACYLLLPRVREELRDFRAGLRSGAITEVPADERAH
ncbi:alanine/glycine:cation symporter family protein [Nocardioides deserti]|uniref:Alanine:cation symporter family protein n=1 Tax=Nocardioides deserti TaxID=1588644 RepID=A0ABR6U8U5_9ACTN|nr:alanine/glycine:cation symporter family protein [Nocardioides deserti]MBC2960700.1 alanine:cation symporter family protein [Nocardioides deserti]GGO77118.1 alanine glycine permease [Nocardioides deserti]